MPKRKRVDYSHEEECFIGYSQKDSPESVKVETGYELATIVQVNQYTHHVQAVAVTHCALDMVLGGGLLQHLQSPR